MATTTTKANGDVVEMAWDPITRIVGSLGIYTKIDFGTGQGRRVPQHVVDLPRLQHLHEGQGPARRPLHHQPHLRDLRRQPRHLLVLRAEHGVRRAPAGARRADRQPRRGRRVHVRPQHLPGEPGRGRLLREDGRRDQPRRARAGQPHRGARTPPTTATRRSATSCGRSTRSPASSTARPAGQPVHAGDVLPDGGPPRPPVDAVPGRRRHDRDHPALHRLLHAADALRGVHEARRADARRPLRLLLRGDARLRGGRPAPGAARLLGRLPGPRRLQLQLPRHDPSGAGPWASRPASSSTASSSPTTSSTSTSASASCSATRSTTTGKTRRCSSRRTRSATRSTAATRGTSTRTRSRRSATSTTSTAGSCRPAGSTAPTTSRSTPAAARSPACGRRRCRVSSNTDYLKATGHSVEINLPQTALKPEVTFEWKIPQWSNTIERDRARTYFQAYAAAAALDFIEKALADVRAGQDQDVGALRGARRGHRLRVHRGGARRAVAPHGDQGRQDRQLPPVPADAVERQPARHLRHARPVRGRGA